MDGIALSAHDVSKRYPVYANQRARLAHALWPRSRHGLQEVWALRGVSFEVRRGEAVAVIGRNGGGKSTLLQILTGTLAATSGEVRVNGRISALLELGSGFNPEYTGRDNVILNGLLLGLRRDEILRRFDEIAAFAEIGDAMERPVKTYSSGMMMRLAFAVQVLTDPDILVVDEALSVGDFFFQQKCFSHLRALRERGLTLLFVSHDMGTVRDLCSRALYLRRGEAAYCGESREAIRRYLAERPGTGSAPAPAPAAGAGALSSHGELDAIVRDATWVRSTPVPSSGQLIAVAFYGEDGLPATAFRIGATLHIKVAYRPAAGEPTHVTAVIRNKFDQVVTSMGSSRLGLAPPAPAPGGAAIFEMRVKLMLEAGNYSVMVTLAHLRGPNNGENVDVSEAIGPLAVQWDYERETAPFLGMFGLEAAGSFTCVGAEP
jgi:lipopolysaccharide transport system ATP-binding protein